MLLLLTLLGFGACFGGQGLKPGDLAPRLESGKSSLKGPAVLVFLLHNSGHPPAERTGSPELKQAEEAKKKLEEAGAKIELK